MLIKYGPMILMLTFKIKRLEVLKYGPMILMLTFEIKRLEVLRTTICVYKSKLMARKVHTFS
jgi:hypothetical protein